MAVQAGQSALDQMLQKEDKRLKKRGRRQRKRNAQKLGTAKTSQDNAQELLTTLTNSRDEMALQGSLEFLYPMDVYYSRMHQDWTSQSSTGPLLRRWRTSEANR